MRDWGEPRVLNDVGPPRHTDFESFYAASLRPLTVQLYAYTGDLGTAQEVVQEAYCRALSRWRQVAELDDPAGWVRRVAQNLATSRWRKARTAMAFVRKHREEYSPEPSPDRVALAKAIATLPVKQRRVVVMFYLADLSVREIARQEGVAEGTVKTRLRRGRAALATKLGDKEECRD
ncbi:SigE family RNA polymerase sigma factor [Dactylosporangium sp. NPDC048998]|uniref:SigE family RNA polymerase sigma factor n=1 Tax=Dactylosporangium sp. NPDC048998 TaxID=3363976 RepID=UPI0037149C8F